MARDIVTWLEGLGLSKYAKAHAENEIDFGALPHVAEEDLKDIGTALGARRKLLVAVRSPGFAKNWAATVLPPVYRPVISDFSIKVSGTGGRMMSA